MFQSNFIKVLESYMNNIILSFKMSTTNARWFVDTYNKYTCSGHAKKVVFWKCKIL